MSMPAIGEEDRSATEPGDLRRDTSITKGSKANSRSWSIFSLPFGKKGGHEKSASFDSRQMSDSSTGMISGAIKPDKQTEKGEKATLRSKFEQGVKLRRLESDVRAQQIETNVQRSHYGQLQDQVGGFEAHRPLLGLSKDSLGKEMSFKARLHAKRNLSSKLAFLVLRDQILTVQCVLHADESDVTKHMVRWAEQIPLESIVLVKGVVQAPAEPLRSTSFAELEIRLTQVFTLQEPLDKLPFHLSNLHPLSSEKGETHKNSMKSPVLSPDGSASERSSLEVSSTGAPAASGLDGKALGHQLVGSAASSSSAGAAAGGGPPVPSLAVRLAHRTLDLRAPSSQAIFRINSAVCLAFRTFLGQQDFVEIHTPKLLGGASESGSSVFGVNYFGRPAFLAQSPQLYKQMCICADFGRVFEIGPVFRAENSNTHRHLTEYTGLDIEMEIGDDYHEAMNLIDDLLKSIFNTVTHNYGRELECLKQESGYQDFVWLEKTPVLRYPEGIKMLVDSGYKDENGEGPTPDEDLSTRAEIRLGELVKEKYKTDYYILDKFPASVRPFYTMPDKQMPGACNSFDIFVRGQEIISGGQRIHDAQLLENNIRKLGIEMKGLEDYVNSFRMAAQPHAGCGIGLERFVMLFLGLPDIRNASLFPRDPKSLRPTHTEELRHPEANTNPPPWKKRGFAVCPSPEELQALPKLIANYGDSSNTSWLDDRFFKWRHMETGSAVGYVKQGETAVIVGNPLCDIHQYPRVIKAFLDEVIRKQKLHPIWLLVSDDVEKVLGENMHWRSVSCNAESRIPTAERRSSPASNEMERKIRQASNNGLSVQSFSVTDEVPKEVKEQVDERIKKWTEGRKGKQVHLTDVDPWRDEAHRAYYVVKEKTGHICALVVLAQLAPANGYQIKWALDFPGAPSGAIEYAISTAVSATPNHSHSFGASATATLTISRAGKGLRGKALSATYESFVKSLHLLNKSDFRRKFSSEEEPLYICYPKGGLSPKTIRNVIDFFGVNN